MSIEWATYIDGVRAFVESVPSVVTAFELSRWSPGQEDPIALVQASFEVDQAHQARFGPDAFPGNASVGVVVCVSKVDVDAGKTAVDIALEIAEHVHHSSMGMAVRHAVVTSFGPATFEHKELDDRYDAARVDIAHNGIVITNRQHVEVPAVPNTQLFLGQDPEIGAAHEDDYWEVPRS